ncbi:DUF1499 domain-containing protein [Siccirubricoccus sp. KC 17139]|uniref:DUF1499 domain-containing protein n=1 Tax=Siccirubricoccus soli TaxID=2899147 RepID=A0ABT1D6B4_9PROT|nr:DUF1499 domain-containing protein [Siccirubricoccus soli]MCO6416815.1 DUF1499 domain-containing protein [Siccirubricoccus soli]MCP2682950.1 DUF1499 domain-containing protein [Siccirubricoccus soli]
MSGLAALFGRGTAGLPPPAPVEFGWLKLPASPNTCLAAPPGAHPQAHLLTRPLPIPVEAAWPKLQAVAAGFPRTWKLAEWPERFQAQWVQRTALLNFPDIIAAELTSGPAGTGLFLYSRSLFGHADFGVNRRRVEAWLAALDAELRRG